jgi:hypothetical protein
MGAPHTKNEEGAPTRNWTECFEKHFSHTGITHSVFCLNDGTSKPPVLLLHELSELSQGTLAYAEKISKDFTLCVLMLFGEKGKFSLLSGFQAIGFMDLSSFPLEVNGKSPLMAALQS